MPQCTRVQQAEQGCMLHICIAMADVFRQPLPAACPASATPCSGCLSSLSLFRATRNISTSETPGLDESLQYINLGDTGLDESPVTRDEVSLRREISPQRWEID